MDLLTTIMFGVLLFMCVYLFWMWFCFGSCFWRRQKTRSPQQRRMYVGSRARPSLGSHEPTIYVSPSNLPPPPKYECMAPPSYEEVVGVHYPQYQVQQPIAQPIATALAQTSQASTAAQSNETVTRSNDETTIVTTVNERPNVTSNSS